MANVAVVALPRDEAVAVLGSATALPEALLAESVVAVLKIHGLEILLLPLYLLLCFEIKAIVDSLPNV